MSMPKAVPKNQVCSECGLDWARHPKKATTDDCIKLLKTDLQNAEWRASYKWPKPYWPQPIVWNIGKVETPEHLWVGKEAKEVKELPYRVTKTTKEWVS